MFTEQEKREIAALVAEMLAEQDRKVFVSTKEAKEMVGLGDARSFRSFMQKHGIYPKHQGNKDLWPVKKIKALAD